jgi:hypothetical protein
MRDIRGDTLIVDLGGNSLKRILATQTQTQVATPKIGTVELSEDSLTGKTVAKLTPVTSATFNNDVVIAIQGEAGTETFYTVDQSDPSPTNGTTPPTFADGAGDLPKSILDQNSPNAATDVTIKAIGVGSGRRSSEIVTARFQFQVANPSFLGSNPGAVDFECATTNAVIYYTTDGSEPTQASAVYPGHPFSVVNNKDDVVVKARAFRPGFIPSRIVSQTFVFTNLQTSSVGILNNFKAGVGGNLIVPINVILNTNDVLWSLQFRVEVTPQGDAPPLVVAPKNLRINPTNDFITVESPVILLQPELAGEYDLVVHSQEYMLPNAANLALLFVSSEPTIPRPYLFRMEKSGIAAIVSVGIPTNAVPGQTYKIEVRFPSGTSDGLETPVQLAALPARTITVENIPFVAGDTAVSTWYNAGDFGNGNLNNNDVNNAFYASVGWRVPYPESDVARAMNVFGGENPDPSIGIEDWQTIWLRGLRLEEGNELISRGLDGLWHTSFTNLNDNANVESEITSTAAPAKAWEAQATIKGGTLENAPAGSPARVPVYLNVAEGAKVAALQFRGIVQSSKGAPHFAGSLRFMPAAGISSPALAVEGKGSAAYGWPLGSFNPQLSGEVLLGFFEFTPPASAAKGDRYQVRFQHGSALYSKGFLGFGVLKAQSIPGSVWIDSAAATQQDPLPDEWKEHFFGRIDSPLADPFGDADGDGINNLEEFRGGTNPAKFFLHRLDQEWRGAAKGGFKLRWLALEGKTYRIESSTDLKTWTEVITVTGTGELKDYIDNHTPDVDLFYRIRIVP